MRLFILAPADPIGYKFDRIFKRVLKNATIPHDHQVLFLERVALYDPDIQFRRSALFAFSIKLNDTAAALKLARINYSKLNARPAVLEVDYGFIRRSLYFLKHEKTVDLQASILALAKLIYFKDPRFHPVYQMLFKRGPEPYQSFSQKGNNEDAVHFF